MKTLALQEPGHPGEWPQALLEISAARQTGWRPLPFRQFILKIHGRCNLACDYCYVYRSADQTWRDQPIRMSRDTVVRTADRIAEHAQAHGLSDIAVVLHGGEPLLAGAEFLSFLSSTIRSAVPDDTNVDLCVHTNATLIDESVLGVLREHDVLVGVSLDGDPATHDAHRLHPGGRGSYGETAHGLDLLRAPAYRDLFAGVLCVVEPQSDPVATYEHLIGFDPPTMDFLLPHANWSNPPSRSVDGSAVPYGDWLVALFDRWYDSPRSETSIRLFEEIIRGVLGRPSRVESIGLAPARHIVVETDGTIEQIDALKSAYEGAAHTGLHVLRDPFDAALSLPQVAARQIGVAALAETCQRCDIRDVCGGGFYPHRYRHGSGFRNPSVYCDDLMVLIRHVHSRVQHDLAPVRIQASE